MIGLRSRKKLAKTAKNDYFTFSIVSLLHMIMKLTKDFKVVFLQGHLYKMSMRILIKDHRDHNYWDEVLQWFWRPAQFRRLLLQPMTCLYRDVWSRHRRLIRQRYAKVFSVPPIRDEGSPCRSRSNPTSKSAAVFVFPFSVTLVVGNNN